MPLLPASRQVLALAPDAQISGAARTLAYPTKWTTLGLNSAAVWGECPGSGRQPYQVVATLPELNLYCSCPSRKRPCKHTLALLLLADAHPITLQNSEAPAWVQTRLATQARRPTPTQPTVNGETRSAVPDSATAQRREARVSAGLEELALWLADLARRGLAAAQTQPPRFWDAMAARLVDAQAPGAARMVRGLSGLPATGPAWPEQLLAGLGRLHLLVAAHQHLAALAPELQAEVRTVLGFTRQHDTVLKEETGVRDHWLVLGRRVEEEDRLRAQRVWLWGVRTQRPALVLTYAAPGQSLDTRLWPGTSVEAEIVFFPGAYPLRALVKSAGAPQPLTAVQGQPHLAAAAAAYGAALARNPWLDRFPVALMEATLVPLDGGWWLRDAAGAGWPVATGFCQLWALLALSGGRPLPVLGEWDGDSFWPLSAWADGRLALLESEGERV